MDIPILGIGSSITGSAGIRNPQAVMYLIPGAYVQQNANVRVNGSPSNTASYRVEGQDITNGNQITQAQQQPSVDAIQEVTVQTSNFAAEYGQVGGGLLNYAMKSGTNQLHGSAYDYAVNEIFNANTPWVNTKAKARRHDYGFTVGGPVALPKIYNGHDKTFFFFNWEQYRETQIVDNLFLTVPTDAYRSATSASAHGTQSGTDPLTAESRKAEVRSHAQRAARTASSFAIYSLKRRSGRAAGPGSAGDQPIPTANLNKNLINNALNPFPARVTPRFRRLRSTIRSALEPSFLLLAPDQYRSAYSAQLSGADGLPEPITQAMGTYTTRTYSASTSNSP
jgi:hypothetical protein